MMKKIFLILGSAALIVACSKSPSPSESYRKFTSDLEKGDLNAAYAMVDAGSRAAIEAQGGVARLGQSAEFIKSHKGIKEIKVVKEELKGDSANSQVQVIFNDGFSGDVKNTFVKENGSWKLNVK